MDDPEPIFCSLWCVLSLKTLAPRLMLQKRSLVVLAVLGSPAVLELLGGGQDSAVILAVWLISIRLLSSHHPIWAGVILGWVPQNLSSSFWYR